MKLHERLFAQEQWRRYDLPTPRLAGEYTLRGLDLWEQRNEYAGDALNALEWLGVFLMEIRSGLICAHAFCSEAGTLAPDWVITGKHNNMESLRETELDHIQLTALIKELDPFKEVAEFSRYFLTDVMIRMHAYVDRAYHFAGLLLGAPAEKRWMLRREYEHLAPRWKCHPIKGALSRIWHHKAFQSWVSRHRNAWTHDAEIYRDDFLPYRVYNELDEVYLMLVSLHDLLWTELEAEIAAHTSGN